MHVSWTPYLKLMRLHQRTGIWLVLFPGWWSIALASNDLIQHYIGLLLLFLIGAIVMRSAGCVINDIWDRDIDRYVERTKSRPLASGALDVKHAIVLLILLLLIGLAILLTLNTLTIMLGIGFAVMAVVYPLMKRIIQVPQLFLGLTINAGALMGWSAVASEVSLPAYLIYVACFFWTLGYDTIYAHQDKEDDVKLGVKSAALAFGERSKAHILSYYLAMIVLLTVAGFLQEMLWLYYVGMGIAFAQLLWQVVTVDLNDRTDCMSKFCSNRVFGWLVFVTIVASGLLQQ